MQQQCSGSLSFARAMYPYGYGALLSVSALACQPDTAAYVHISSGQEGSWGTPAQATRSAQIPELLVYQMLDGWREGVAALLADGDMRELSWVKDPDRQLVRAIHPAICR